MSIRTLATLAVAIVFGFFAVMLVRGYIGGAAKAPAQAVQGSVPVVVSAHAMARGENLTADALKVVRLPQDAVPDQAFHSVSDVVGGQARTVLRSLVQNQPVLPADVSGQGDKSTLSLVVVAGMRAVSVKSNDVAGVGGFVLPGDRVDVILTRGTSNDTNSTVTQVVAENVRVLGVDQFDVVTDGKPVVAKSVTVEVTPEQAQSISLGQQIGNVTLALRRLSDGTPLGRTMMTVSDLGGVRKAASHAAGPSVRVIRGSDASGFNLNRGGALKLTASAASGAAKAP